MICNQCPRRCGALRTETAGNGFCRMPAFPRLARAALHFGEEPCLGKASGAVFFSGCSLRCRFCQNEEISHRDRGKTVSPERLAEIFRQLEQAGAENIDLVNPTHYAHGVLQALKLYRPTVPVIWNSGGYERVETLRALEGYVDIYLPDLKYIHGELAKALSGAEDYFAFAGPAILEMARQTGPVQLDAQGQMRRGTLVRHLALPGHTTETMAVLRWLAEHKDALWVSLMFQYTPMGSLDDFPELQRPLTKRECEKLWRYMEDLGITDGYIQERESSGTGMIPLFDGTGV